MKVLIKGANSCMNRKNDLYRWRNYVIATGHSLVEKPEDADIILVWGCSFRKDYHDNSFKLLHEMNQRYDAEVILCGCLPSIDPQGVKTQWHGRSFAWKDQDIKMPEIFGEAQVPFDCFERTYVEPGIENIDYFKLNHPEAKVVFHDQFMKLFISEGCTLNCSYCADIRAFPKYKSYPLKKLILEVKRMYRLTGQHKVLFCGDSVGDYGIDIEYGLIDLVDGILGLGDQFQVGFNNFNPLHFMKYHDELIERLNAGRICFMDLPFQSADDRVLRLMDRGYNREDISRIFQAINVSGFKELETDVIVGFPSETESEFLKTVDFLLEHRPKYVQGSGYMDVTGSRASGLLPDKVPQGLIEDRLARMKLILRENGILFDSAGENTLKEWPDLL